MQVIDLDFYINDSSDIDDTYIVSPLYYRITGRKSAWQYKNMDSYVVVAQQSHKNNTLLLFPELGSGDYTLTAHGKNSIDEDPIYNFQVILR